MWGHRSAPTTAWRVGTAEGIHYLPCLGFLARLKVIGSRKFLSFLWWLKIKFKAIRSPRRLLGL